MNKNRTKCRLFFILIAMIYSMQLNARCIGYTFREQCKKATEIFIGRVISIENNKSEINGETEQTVKIVTIHSWKGTVQDTITLTHTISIFSCYNRSKWVENEIFVVYTTNNEVNFCPGRTNIADDNEDIQKLNLKYWRYKYKQEN